MRQHFRFTKMGSFTLIIDGKSVIVHSSRHLIMASVPANCFNLSPCPDSFGSKICLFVTPSKKIGNVCVKIKSVLHLILLAISNVINILNNQIQQIQLQMTALKRYFRSQSTSIVILGGCGATVKAMLKFYTQLFS